MALLAETLVEEWLNRQRFFTVRGVKEGVGEMDLLAVRKREESVIEALHVEVQVSFSPLTYMSNLTPHLAKSLHKSKGSAFHRDEEMLRECVEAWVRKKFHVVRKVKRRELFWPGLEWKPVLVHGVFKYPEELRMIGALGVQLVPLKNVLDELFEKGKPEFTAAAGGDLAALIQFYASGG